MADGQHDNPEDKDKREANRMDFIVEQQARIDASLELVGERLNQLAARDAVLSRRQENLTAQVENLTTDVENLTADVASLVHGVEDFKDEVRGAIQNLIVANEVTRDLAEQVARLAIQTSQRVADLEGQ